MSHDQAGLTHIAVPLLLGKQCLGPLLRGRCSADIPNHYRCSMWQGVCISAQTLWHVARMQRPVSISVFRHLAICSLLWVMLFSSNVMVRSSKRNWRRPMDTSAYWSTVSETTRFYRRSHWARDQLECWSRRMFGHSEANIVGQNFSCMFTSEDIQNHVPRNS